jgi:hypothetical protein
MNHPVLRFAAIVLAGVLLGGLMGYFGQCSLRHLSAHLHLVARRALRRLSRPPDGAERPLA